MKLNDALCVGVETKLRTRIINCATGKIEKQSPWQKNLILDNGLNALARSTNPTYPAEFAAAVRIGSGNRPNSTASGAVTFTQSGTTITASAPFFTADMVGQLFKYGVGTGGAEYYITGYTDSTHVTVDTSATVAVPTVATVWNVAQTQLETLLFSSATYDTSPGACQSTFSGDTVSHKRTINFPSQGSTYNVNEIGYFRSTSGSIVYGRIVLSSTDVVPPTSFYQVEIIVTFRYTPSTPTAVANVGTNIDTSGNAMLEVWDSSHFARIQSNGSVSTPPNGSSLDGSANCGVHGAIADYQQNGTTNSGAVSWGSQGTGRLAFASGQNWTYAGVRGKMTLSSNTSITTNGQTLYGVGIGLNTSNEIGFDVKFTTPFTLPVGSFLPQCVFSVTYDRILTN